MTNWARKVWDTITTPTGVDPSPEYRDPGPPEPPPAPRPEPTAHVDTKTAGQLALPDRGATITAQESGLTVRGILLDFSADYALVWDMGEVNPHIHTGLITLTITGLGHDHPVEVEVSPTTTITLTRWRTP